ncbi:MAG: MurR/RpiR family transcriptional regulator [Clostridiales bacterium]|nr:MurR/RpiR family transcriptional regulator [Clostridiales bacterium]
MIIEQIRKSYPQMSAVERKIADVILEDAIAVTNMTIAHLAARAAVSEGSVVNFATRLGLQGFSALKIGLARESETFVDFSFGSVSAKDSPRLAPLKIAGNAVDAFQRTSRTLDEECLRQAAEQLMAARRIDIYGAGDSALMARDADLHLMRIGLPAHAVTDYLSFQVAAAQLDENCVALAISHSGQTSEIVDAMETARQHGAQTICVTSYGDSALARLCNTALVTVSREAELHEEASAARLTHLLVLDSLCAYISARQGSAAVEHMDWVNTQLSRRRYPR